MKIRIAYLIDTLSSDKAGTEKQLLNIIKRIDKSHFEITLLCLYESPWMAQNQFSCEVISLGYKGFLRPSFLWVMVRYLQILKRRKFDLVQTFFEDSIFIGYLGKKLSKYKHKLIISRRDLGLGTDEPIYHRFYRKVMPYVYNTADGIAVNANSIKEHIINRYNVIPAKVRVINNGLDIPYFSFEKPALFSENHADLWIGIVANLKPIKRIDILLRALAYIKNSGKIQGFRTVILGEGRLRKELIQLAVDLGIDDVVHFMGAVGNVTDYLHCLDIGVLCSDKEGLSNAILEYMACGLPVAATAVGGNTELVDNSNGFTVPAGNFAALGEALNILATSPELRTKLGNRSKDKIMADFTWNKIITQWENHYHLIVRAESATC
jgi:glycosyltransferase involved in cell wall biosynthesis